MSYTVNTSAAPFCHSQNHSGGVPVPTLGVTAGSAQEGSLRESELLRGSCKTARTRHRRVRGLHQHHLPASPPATVDQLSLGCAYRSVSSLAGHRGSRQAPWLEILDGNQLVPSHNAFRPYAGVISRLTCSFLVQLRRRELGPPVTTGLGSTLTGVSPRHRALRFGQLRSAPLAVAQIGQIESHLTGSCRGDHPPVHTDSSSGGRCWGDLTPHNERCIPVAQRVSMDSYRCGLTGQGPRPHHRHADTFGQVQTTGTNREAAGGVLQRGQALPPALEHRPPSTPQLAGAVEGLCVGPQHLLLGDLRPFPQPQVPSTDFREQLPESGESGNLAALLPVNSLVPQKTATMPLRHKRSFSTNSRPKSVVVPHDFLHTRTLSKSTDTKLNADQPRSHLKNRVISNTGGS